MGQIQKAWIFLIQPILEARAETGREQKKSFVFGTNETKKIYFWNLPTFNWLSWNSNFKWFLPGVDFIIEFSTSFSPIFCHNSCNFWCKFILAKTTSFLKLPVPFTSIIVSLSSLKMEKMFKKSICKCFLKKYVFFQFWMCFFKVSIKSTCFNLWKKLPLLILW